MEPVPPASPEMLMAQLVAPPPVPAKPHHSPAGGAFAHFTDEEIKRQTHSKQVLSWEAVAGCRAGSLLPFHLKLL